MVLTVSEDFGTKRDILNSFRKRNIKNISTEIITENFKNNSSEILQEKGKSGEHRSDAPEMLRPSERIRDPPSNI